jgi:hypothetical protein
MRNGEGGGVAGGCVERIQSQFMPIASPLRWLFLLILSLLVGCHQRDPDIYAPVPELNWDHPKLTAMRQTLEPLTRQLIHDEERARGRPRIIKYMISIDPRFSNGYAIGGEGLKNAWDTGIYIGWSFQCAAETIDHADTAVVDYALIGADGDLYIGNYLYLWRQNHWISGAECSLQLLEKMDPTGARKFRETLKSVENSRRPTTTTTQATVPD